MKTQPPKLIPALALLALLSTLNSQPSICFAQGTAFTYQGRLQDHDAPANGRYDLTFALFDASQNGNQAGTTLTNLATVVTNGLFTVTLDFGAQFPGADRWLAIGVRTNGDAGGFTVLTPRQPVTATPYAVQALNAATAATAATAGSAGTVAAAGITGTIPLAQLPAGLVTNGANGVNLSGTFSGDGGGLTNLKATQLSGTIPAAVLPDVLNTLSEQGIGNFFAGSGAGASVTTGNANTGNGDQALAANTTGEFNTANGDGALYANTTGNYNTANGYGALQANTSGSDNTANGSEVLQANTTGDGNTAAGATALQANTTGGFNTAVGNGALFNNTNGNHNIAIGSQAGGNLISGNNNIYLGNLGVNGESGVIRIGIPGTQTDTYLAGTVHGNGGGLTNLNAAQLIGAIPTTQLSGTIPLAQLPDTVLTSGNGSGITIQQNADDAPNMIEGSSVNFIASGVEGATISGGGTTNYYDDSYTNSVTASFGTVGGGEGNTASGENSTIGGGSDNTASDTYATVGGGLDNTASNFDATVNGGDDNTASGNSSTVSGGNGNNASGVDATVSGGSGNSAADGGATVGGGVNNQATNTYATVPGGYDNVAGGQYSFAAGDQAQATNDGAFVWADMTGGPFASTNNNSFNVRAKGGVRFVTGGAGMTVDGQPVLTSGADFLGGGSDNSIQSANLSVLGGGDGNYVSNSVYCFLGGGGQNSIQSGNDYAFLGGGLGNSIQSAGYSYSFLGSGTGNTIQTGATYAFLGGGGNNSILANSTGATIPGGSGNSAGGEYSFAAGDQAQATNNGAFVWADTTGGPFASTNNNSFNVRANGGVRFVTGGAGMTIDGQPVLTSGNGSGITIQQNADDAPNVIGGSSLNFVAGGVEGAAIGGGGTSNDGGSPYSKFNSVTANFGTVGGGEANIAGGFSATVGGGDGNTASSDSATVGGGFDNRATTNCATVGGGEGNTASGGQFGCATVGGGLKNTASGGFATVGGGEGNTASGILSTVGGGGSLVPDGFGVNTANGDYATVGGGEANTASGLNATVSGGYYNTAGGKYSFAAGQQAQALHQGAFVWADSQNATFSSTANDQFLIRAQGGVGIGTGTTVAGSLTINTNVYLDDHAIYLRGLSGVDHNHGLGYNGQTITNFGTGQYQIDGPALWGYSGGLLGTRNGGDHAALQWNTTSVTVNGTFNNLSDRNAKQDFATITPAQILTKVTQLPLTEWSYKMDTATRHIGPMAQDFYAAFNIGTDDRHIAPIDENGVALAAIQGLNEKLNEKLEQKETEITELQARLDKLEQLILVKTGGAK